MISMISGVHHVKVPVTDVQRSRAWYERVLGLTTDIEFVEDGVLRGVALTTDGTDGAGGVVALRHDPARAIAMAGFDPVALRVSTREGVHAWAARLDEQGEPHGGITTGHRGGTVLAGLHDPDGIEIRLYAD